MSKVQPSVTESQQDLFVLEKERSEKKVRIAPEANQETSGQILRKSIVEKLVETRKNFSSIQRSDASKIGFYKANQVGVQLQRSNLMTADEMFQETLNDYKKNFQLSSKDELMSSYYKSFENKEESAAKSLQDMVRFSVDQTFIHNSNRPTTQSFIDATKFSIPVHKLYEIIDHRSENELNTFSAVLVEIQDDLVECMGDKENKFALKVFHKSGTLFFQRFLYQKPLCWHSFQNILIFVRFPTMQDILEKTFLNVVHVVVFDLEHGSSLFRVQIADFIDTKSTKHLGFENNTLYIVNENPDSKAFECHIVPLGKIQDKSFATKETLLVRKVMKTITFSAPFHGFIDSGDTCIGVNKDLPMGFGHAILNEKSRPVIKHKLIMVIESKDELKFLELSTLLGPSDPFKDFIDTEPFTGAVDITVKMIDQQEQYSFEIPETSQIKKCVHRIFCEDDPDSILGKKKFHSSVVWKEGNRLEYYYNFRKVFDSQKHRMTPNPEDDISSEIVDIFSTFKFHAVIRKLPSKLEEAEQFTLKMDLLSWKNSIGQNTASWDKKTYPKAEMDDKISFFVHTHLKNYMTLFRSVLMVGNSFVVCHDRVLSAYSLNCGTWKHFCMTDQIEFVNTRNSGNKSIKDQRFNVLLTNGSVCCFDVKFTAKGEIILVEKNITKSMGFVRQSLDFKASSASFLVLTDEHPPSEKIATYSVVGKTPDTTNKYGKHKSVLLNPNRSAQNYKLWLFVDTKFVPFPTKSKLLRNGVTKLLSHCQAGKFQDAFVLATQDLLGNEWIEFNKFQFDYSSESFSKLDQVLAKNELRNKKFDHQERLRAEFSIDSVIQCEADPTKHFVISDGTVFVMQVREEEGISILDLFFEVGNMRVKNAIAIDRDMVYLISDGFPSFDQVVDDDTGIVHQVNSSDLHPGLYVFDAARWQNGKLSPIIRLAPTIGGKNNILHVSMQGNRIAYFKDYKKIEILPSAHSNVIEFLGLPPVDTILCIREEMRIFSVLTPTELRAWSVITGKEIAETQNIKVQIAENLTLADFHITKNTTQHFPDFSCQLLMQHQDQQTRPLKRPMEESVTVESIFIEKPSHQVPREEFHFALVSIAQNRFNVEFRFFQAAADSSDPSENESLNLKFSEDLRKMLQVKNDGRVIIFSRVDQESIDGKLVSWTELYHINNINSEMLERTRFNYLFTPDFEQFLSFDYQNTQLLVRNSKDFSVRGVISKKMYSLKLFKALKNQQSIFQLISRVQLLSDTRIRLHNKTGLDCVYNYMTNTVETFCSLDTFQPYDFSEKHAILDRKRIPPGNIEKQLIEQANNFKQTSAFYEDLEILYESDKKKNWQCLVKLNEIQLSSMYSMQFYDDENTGERDYYAKHSFCLIDWIICEQIATFGSKIQKEFQFMSKATMRRICFNIVPGYSTIFHFLAETESNNSLQIAQTLLDMVTKDNSDDPTKRVYAPMIRNYQGQTALEMCLKSDDGFGSNFPIAKIIFEQIKNYPTFSVRSINSSVSLAIEKGVPNMSDFLESRLKKHTALYSRNWVRNCVDNTWSKMHYESNTRYNVCNTTAWFDKVELARKIFNSRDQELVQDISSRIIDIPDLHLPGHYQSVAFFRALAYSNDTEMFKSHVIQLLILSRWRSIKDFIIYQRILLWAGGFLFFHFWTHLVLKELVLSPNVLAYETANQALVILIFIFCGLQIAEEILYFVVVVQAEGLKEALIYRYTTYERFVSITSPLMTIAAVLSRISVSSVHEPVARSTAHVLAVASFFLWLKLPGFLRAFRQTSWLIRAIINIGRDVAVFVLLLIFAILAITDPMYMIGNSFRLPVKGQNVLYPTYQDAILKIFKTALGDWDTDEFDLTDGSRLMFVFWIVCVLFNLIVMLNLLIAIISSTFENCQQTQIEHSFIEKAKIIEENQLIHHAIMRINPMYTDPRFTSERFLFVVFEQNIGASTE